MKTLTGTYFNGQLKLDKPLKTRKPIKVTITFDENEDKSPLRLSDFSFLESQEMLRNFRGSFSEEVVEERRREI